MRLNFRHIELIGVGFFQTVLCFFFYSAFQESNWLNDVYSELARDLGFLVIILLESHLVLYSEAVCEWKTLIVDMVVSDKESRAYRIICCCISSFV